MAEAYPAVPGRSIDVGNKLLKPVTNGFSTYRGLWYSLYEGHRQGRPVQGSPSG